MTPPSLRPCGSSGGVACPPGLGAGTEAGSSAGLSFIEGRRQPRTDRFWGAPGTRHPPPPSIAARSRTTGLRGRWSSFARVAGGGLAGGLGPRDTHGRLPTAGGKHGSAGRGAGHGGSIRGSTCRGAGGTGPARSSGPAPTRLGARPAALQAGGRGDMAEAQHHEAGSLLHKRLLCSTRSSVPLCTSLTPAPALGRGLGPNPAWCQPVPAGCSLGPCPRCAALVGGRERPPLASLQAARHRLQRSWTRPRAAAGIRLRSLQGEGGSGQPRTRAGACTGPLLAMGTSWPCPAPTARWSWKCPQSGAGSPRGCGREGQPLPRLFHPAGPRAKELGSPRAAGMRALTVYRPQTRLKSAFWAWACRSSVCFCAGETTGRQGTARPSPAPCPQTGASTRPSPAPRTRLRAAILPH